MPSARIEVVSWTLVLSTGARPDIAPPGARVGPSRPNPDGYRSLFDPISDDYVSVPVYVRESLAPGARVDGTAIITEGDTSTLVPASFQAVIDSNGFIDCRRVLSPPAAGADE